MQTFRTLSRPGLKTVLLLLAGVWLVHCAVRQPPPGGPEDKTAPQVVRTYPPADSTGIAQLEYLEIQFDETIDRSSVTDQIGLIPEPPGGFKVEWKGSRTLRIVLGDSLADDQTYILNIGTGVKDLRNNRLASPVVLPFSTGPNIDRGEIAGRVLAERVEGVYIYAYEIDGEMADTTVFSRRPRYYTQVERSGQYRIQYLRPALYRVYALDDASGDRLYTLQTDRIGIPSRDVQLDSSNLRAGELNFTLIQEDTTGPRLVRAQAVHQHILALTFNEPLAHPRDVSVQLVDSVGRDSLAVLAIEQAGEAPEKLSVYTATQTTARYVGTIRGLTDVAENTPNATPLTFSFSGSEDPDTLTAALKALNPPNGQTKVRYDTHIELRFTQPIDSATLKPALRLLDPDSQTVAGQWQFRSLLAPQFVPDSLLQKGTEYRLLIDLTAIESVYRAPPGDSLLSAAFTTWEWAELGEIAGTVFASDTAGKTALIEAEPFNGSGKYSAAAPPNTPYLIPFLPDGLYRLRAGIDDNQNARLDPGRSLPFQYSEPFQLYPDSVKVRKRWTTDGIDFRFSPK